MFNRVNIGKGTCIGAGSLVTKNCDAGKLYLGGQLKIKEIGIMFKGLYPLK